MRNFTHHKFFIAFLINGFLFFVILSLFKPCYSTDTDIYFLYTLSGGYGNAPTNLLHFSYGAHPILGWISVGLFSHFPRFNWYSFLLLSFHFVCCTSLLFSFLQYFSKLYAIVVFTIFFLFIESMLLLKFNYSGTALIGAISGSISLLLFFTDKNQRNSYLNKKFLFFSLLILVSGMIRIHYMVLFVAMVLCMAIFILSRRQFYKFIIIHVIIGIVFLILFQGQKYYYEKKIPQWKQEEQLRSAYYNIINHPGDKPKTNNSGFEKLKQDMAGIYYLFDKNLVNYETVKQISNNRIGWFHRQPVGLRDFYWLFRSLRVYFLLFAAVIFFFVMDGQFKLLFKFICLSMFSVLIAVIIILFFKITELIILSILSFILLSAIICLQRIIFPKPSLIAGAILILLGSGWMIIRLLKVNVQNEKVISQTRSLIKEFNSHPGLFIETGPYFDFHLSIWDLPEKYPLRNLIDKGLIISNSYASQLARYGITDLMKEIPVKDNIYLVGNKVSILIEYYKLLYNQTVHVKKVPGFEYIDAYQITTDNK